MRSAILAAVLSSASSGGGSSSSSGTPLSSRTWTSAAVQRMSSHVATMVGVTGVYSSMPVKMIGSWAGIKFDFCNFIHPGVVASYPAGTVQIIQVALHRVSTGQVVPITFGGARTKTLNANAVHQLSDEILPSAFGLSSFGAGDYMIRSWIEAPIGTNFPVTGCGAFGWRFDPATQQPNVDSTTSFIGNTSNIGAFVFGPVVVGRVATTRAPAVFIVGDSIIDGFSPQSWIMGACENLGSPCIEYPLGGTHQAQLAAGTEWRSYMQYADAFIDEMGTNNPSATSGFGVYWTEARQTYGHHWIAHIGGLPKTNSSDSFTTLSGQSPQDGVDVWWDSLEAFFATQITAGLLTFQHRMTSVADPGNVKRWITNGTANYATQDGLHPTPAMAPLLTAEAQPLILGLLAQIPAYTP